MDVKVISIYKKNLRNGIYETVSCSLITTLWTNKNFLKVESELRAEESQLTQAISLQLATVTKRSFKDTPLDSLMYGLFWHERF